MKKTMMLFSVCLWEVAKFSWESIGDKNRNRKGVKGIRQPIKQGNCNKNYNSVTFFPKT